MVTGDGAPGTGPTDRRIILGAQLRRLREATQLNRADAGYTIRASESKMRRLETGQVGFKERDVADLLTLWFEDFVGLEEFSPSIQTYEQMFVPQVLETEDYARADAGHGELKTR